MIRVLSLHLFCTYYKCNRFVFFSLIRSIDSEDICVTSSNIFRIFYSIIRVYVKEQSLINIKNKITLTTDSCGTHVDFTILLIYRCLKIHIVLMWFNVKEEEKRTSFTIKFQILKK